MEATGVDVVALTDHQTVAGALELAGRLPCRVVVGQECRTGAGELTGLFLRERVPPGLPPDEVAAAIRAQGGLVYAPHPFDRGRRGLHEDVLVALARAGALDAVEVFNAKVAEHGQNQRAAAFAAAWGLARGAGSDAHVPAAVGAACVEMDDFTDAASFLAALRSPSARVVGHHHDPPRPWSARVVPSTKRPTR